MLRLVEGRCQTVRQRGLDAREQVAVDVDRRADDLSLSNACLDVHPGIRRRDWAALERLLAAIPPGGDLDDIFDIPADECITALHAAVRLGWHRPGA